jgi:hypothetical protein
VAAATVCSLLWAVTGVSVLAIAYHEYHHHHAETHNHDDAFEMVFNCHDREGTPHHDHELTAPLTVSRTQFSVQSIAIDSQANDLDDAVLRLVSSLIRNESLTRDPDPPTFLLHCVSLT